MQFIENGPDIPDSLLQAHEEGRVVFFCGAGISYPAGLPGFQGLVENIYQENETERSVIENDAFERGQFDTTLDLLERRLPGQRFKVRCTLMRALKPRICRKGALDTQKALLQLATNRDGKLRLVTTNYDRTFHIAAYKMKQEFETYAAPMLPVPKNSRWNGLVYLHGLLPLKPEETALNRLVLTSGDFGLAYLAERWAARFVSDLFRNYIVCFVGYSINDPVLRYIMDALAADRLLGESTPQAWALADCKPGEEQQKSIEWEAKGVTPILYNTDSNNSNDHSVLHQTLHAWANTYHDGVEGKEAIVVKYASVHPQKSSQQDDFVGRMLWALSDSSGLPAKRFAKFNPAPPLDWLLESFGEEYFTENDAPRFDVQLHGELDTNFRFSLIKRPVSHDLELRMSLVSAKVFNSKWDKVMPQLARWLLRHLDDPRLILWAAEQGGNLHEEWSRMIQNELERFAKLECDGDTSKLDEIRLHAPNAIPSQPMRKLWRLLLAGRVKSYFHSYDLSQWDSCFNQEGLTLPLRMALREILKPKVLLKKKFVWEQDDSSRTNEAVHIKDLLDFELVLTDDYVHSTLNKIKGEQWQLALPHLFDDFQQLLRDALDLLRFLEEPDEQRERSIIDLPSIMEHYQNRGLNDWVSLIELLRDSWLEISLKDSGRASRLAQVWFELPYPIFKRLALFAASQDDCISDEKWVDWLLADDSCWLWSMVTKREVCRLLVLQGSSLNKTNQKRLEKAILKGAPRTNDREDSSLERWVEEGIWLRLAKLEHSGISLGLQAKACLTKISKAYPHLQLKENESDEFSIWMSATGDPGFDDKKQIHIAPTKRKDLVLWLEKTEPENGFFYEDNWREVCRKYLLNSLCALNDLANKGNWPIERWRDALQVWSDKRAKRSWQYAATVVQSLPDKILHNLGHQVAWWLASISKLIDCQEPLFLNLCQRILTAQITEKKDARSIKDDTNYNYSVNSAINHPVGMVTQALLNYWFKQEPSDNGLLPNDLKDIFTQLCDVETEQFRHARVLLASNLVALFRVDRTWTEEYLLPLFDWNNPIEAKAVWEGFLWSPRLHQPLLLSFKSYFLDTVNHYDELGNQRQRYAAFLTHVALNPADICSIEELRNVFVLLPIEGLESSAQALFQILDAAGDQREEFWRNRVIPFWKNIWPKDQKNITPRVSDALAKLAIASGEEFPNALSLLRDWLNSISDIDYIVYLLCERELCKEFPEEALGFLDAVIAGERIPSKLEQCLEQIIKVKPDFEEDRQYIRLRDCSRG